MTRRQKPTKVQTVRRDGDAAMEHKRWNPKGTGETVDKRLKPKILADLRVRKVTNKAVAEKLGVSETYVSRKVAALQTKERGKVALEREAKAKLYKVRAQVRDMLAKKVNKNQMTVALAAAEAGCTIRTMFRYCAKYKEQTK